MRSFRPQTTLLCLAILLLASTSLACRIGPSTPTQPPPTDTPVPTGCTTTLNEETLKRLVLSLDNSIEMQPGKTQNLSLLAFECCHYFEPVETCVTWSVEPSEGASIDPERGVLTVEAGVPSGSVFTVSADVEDGRRILSIPVYIFTPQDNPLVGIWREEVQFACGTGTEVSPESPIDELRFRADGTFGVTWQPFEVYVDYWGSYQYSLAQGTLDLAVTGANYSPDDVDGNGLFSLDEQGRLILSDMWLGSPSGGKSSANCGHRFAR